VAECIVQQRGDMLVVERVDALATPALGENQAVLTQHPELVGDSRLLHSDRLHQLTDGMRALP